MPAGKKVWEKKIDLLSAKRASAAAAAKRDDKKWKKRWAKADDKKKALIKGVAKGLDKGRQRGVTRRSLTRKALSDKAERKPDQLTYECTIHVGKLVKGSKFAARAPKAVKKIRAFAGKLMKTKDNRVDASLNTYIWSRGVKGVPKRIRVRITRKVSENPDGRSKRKRLHTIISHAGDVPSLKGLLTKTVTA